MPDMLTAGPIGSEGGALRSAELYCARVSLTRRGEIAATLPNARPPFDWLMEITSELGVADYFKHYLIRENDIVLAHRKTLTPIDDLEAKIILADLAAVKKSLKKLSSNE